VPSIDGSLTDYAAAIAVNRAKDWYVFPGTPPDWIMGCYPPETLPVISALPRGYAV
jgi:phospholipase C